MIMIKYCVKTVRLIGDPGGYEQVHNIKENPCMLSIVHLFDIWFLLDLCFCECVCRIQLTPSLIFAKTTTVIG